MQKVWLTLPLWGRIILLVALAGLLAAIVLLGVDVF